MPSVAKRNRAFCRIPTLVGADPPEFKECGQEVKWIVSMHDRALAVCAQHKERYAMYGELVTYVELDD